MRVADVCGWLVWWLLAVAQPPFWYFSFFTAEVSQHREKIEREREWWSWSHVSPSFSFWFIALIKTDRGPISPARFGRPQLGHRLNSFAFTPVPRRRKICALLLTSCFMARGGVAEREGLAAPLRCCYKSHATPKKMGRTSKVAKTHKSPFSFSSRSKKHFLRFSNRKKKGNARRQGDSIQHPDGFHIVETRDSFAAPFARQVMCWEREKYSVSLQQENRLTETCVCVCAAARITLHLQLWCISREFRLSLQFRMVSKKANEKKKKKSRAVVYVCCVECQLKQLASYGGKKKKEILKWFERRKRKKKKERKRWNQEASWLGARGRK